MDWVKNHLDYKLGAMEGALAKINKQADSIFRIDEIEKKVIRYIALTKIT
jgi:hypothetical protein